MKRRKALRAQSRPNVIPAPCGRERNRFGGAAWMVLPAPLLALFSWVSGEPLAQAGTEEDGGTKGDGIAPASVIVEPVAPATPEFIFADEPDRPADGQGVETTSVPVPGSDLVRGRSTVRVNAPIES